MTRLIATRELDPWERTVLNAVGKSAPQIARETGLSLTTVVRVRISLRDLGYKVPVLGYPKGKPRKPAALDQIRAMFAAGMMQRDVAAALGVSESAILRTCKLRAISRPATDRKRRPVTPMPEPSRTRGPFRMAVMQQPDPRAHLARQTMAVI